MTGIVLYQEDVMAIPLKYKPHGSLRAFCDSKVCFPRRSKMENTTLGVELKVPKDTISCPRCKAAVYWIRDSEIYKFKGSR